MNTSRTINSVKNAGVNLLARLTGQICAFILRTIFLRYLGAQYTGISTLFTDILHILSFTELGMGTAISYAFYKPVSENDEYRIAQLMKLCRYLYGFISASVLVLGMCLLPFLDMLVRDVPNIKESISYIYILYVLKTSLSYLLVYKSTLLIANQKQYIVTACEAAVAVIKTGVEVILLIFFGNFMFYLYVEVVSTIATNLLISFFARRKDPSRRIQVKLPKNDFKDLFKNIKATFIYKVNGIILNSTDSLIISSSINTAAVAYMSNYNLLFNAVSTITFQIISAMTASVGNFAISKSGQEQKHIFCTINFLCYIFTGIAVTGLWLCSGYFVEIIFGPRYVLSDSIVILLAMNLFMINMHQVVDMFRTANGIFQKGKMRPLVTAIINLVVSLVAVRYLGLFGVVLGTVVSRLTTQVWYDSKLIFNIVFQESAWHYYRVYCIYSGLTIVICFCGACLLNALPFSVYGLFAVGFFYAIFANMLVVILFFRKTNEFESALGYLRGLLKR